MKCLNEIDATEVGKYYIKSEISRNSNDNSLNYIDTYGKEKTKDCVRELSCGRKNEVYTRIYCKKYVWKKCELDSNEVKLSCVNSKVNECLEKAEFKLNCLSQLMKYNENLKDEFSDWGKEIVYNTLIGIEYNGKVRIIDGIHRAVILFNRGKREFYCYTGFQKSKTI